jgi:hypothetical protein
LTPLRPKIDQGRLITLEHGRFKLSVRYSDDFSRHRNHSFKKMCLDPMVGSGVENYWGNFPWKIIISSSYSIVMFFFKDVFGAF